MTFGQNPVVQEFGTGGAERLKSQKSFDFEPIDGFILSKSFS